MSMLWAAKQVTPAMLEEIKRNPGLLDGILKEAAVGVGALDLDKAWNGIHWILTGEIAGGDPPLSKIIYGGTEIGEDMGYGPARYLTAQDVREVADALSVLPRDSLRQRYDPAAMDEAGVYPSGWADEPEEGLTWLLERFDLMAPYFQDAAKKGNAILTFLY